MTDLGCCIPRFESSLYNLSLVLFYMEGFLHFLGWPEAYFEETTDAQGEGLRRNAGIFKFEIYDSNVYTLGNNDYLGFPDVVSCKRCMDPKHS